LVEKKDEKKDAAKPDAPKMDVGVGIESLKLDSAPPANPAPLAPPPAPQN